MLDESTLIEVIETEKGIHSKQVMTFGSWKKEFRKKKGCTYNAYQLNFSQFKLKTT